MLKINSKTYFVRVQLSFILRRNTIFLCLKGKWEVLVIAFSTTLLSPIWFPSGELGIILNLELVSVTSVPCHWYCGSFLHGDQAKTGYQGGDFWRKPFTEDNYLSNNWNLFSKNTTGILLQRTSVVANEREKNTVSNPASWAKLQYVLKVKLRFLIFAHRNQ